MRKLIPLMALVLGILLAGCSTATKRTEPAAWSGLTSGMTRQEIVAKLGQPSGRTASGEDTWRRGDWELRVGYGQRGQTITIVRQLLKK